MFRRNIIAGDRPDIARVVEAGRVERVEDGAVRPLQPAADDKAEFAFQARLDEAADRDLRVQASARGSAEIRNYITTLQTLIDLKALAAGDYQLAVKHDDGDWQMYPLRLR